MNIAIIPARGGSKRIPGKNKRVFLGRPLIGYSIRTAIRSGLFDHVIVSTDDLDISELSRACGALVPFERPASLSGDLVGTIAVVQHALRWVEDHLGQVSHACCIYPCAPFLRESFLAEGLARLCESGKSYAFAVTRYPFPIQRAVRITMHGTVEALWPENSDKRSQDLEPVFHDAGQFYWGTSEAFLRGQAIYSEAAVPVILPRYLVQDIDTEEDWVMAEAMYRAIASLLPGS